MPIDKHDLWLLLAKHNEPMSIAEIAKALNVGEQEIMEILQQERHCFRLETDGRWSLEVWYLPINYPFLTKAELILWHANGPVPEPIFLHLLEKVHRFGNSEGFIIVLHSRPETFVFDGSYWHLGEIPKHLENYVRKSIERKKEKIKNLLEQTHQPFSLDELMVQSGLSEEFEGYANERSLSEAQRIMLKQLVGSLLHQTGIDGIINLPSGRWIAISQHRWQKVLNALQSNEVGFTTQEILHSVLQIQIESNDELALIEHLQKRLEECEQVESIDGKWYAKLLSFVSSYTFYDINTFTVIVEKGEIIERGSPKEQWLKEKGFYKLARLGGEQ